MFASSSPLTLLKICVMAWVLCDVAYCEYDVRLEHMTSVKLPVYNGTGGTVWQFGSGSVKKMSLDVGRKILYVTGEHQIHYLDISDPSKLLVIGYTSLPALTFYDIKACGDDVMATYTQHGKSGLLVAKAYNPAHQFPVILLETIYDAGDPLSLAVTSDCQTAIVAINGKAIDNMQFQDPRAAVVVISVAAILAREQNVTDAVNVLRFDAFDKRADELEQQGVRFPLKGQVGLLSQDLDPSYVTIDDVTKTAYVTLQVNNAIAKVDLVSRTITSITALGWKDWREQPIDVSDKDGVTFQRPPIYSLYQPGAITVMYHSGGTYLLTANTGAKRDYSDYIGWSEVMSGRELVNNKMLASSVEPQLLEALKDESRLGSLLFTIIEGNTNYTSIDDARGTLSTFLTFGGRSFSIRQLPDLDFVYDSGSEVEMRTADSVGDVFNCPVLEGSRVIIYDRDLTSIDKGPEPFSIAWGKLGSLTIVAVGLANPGGVLLYSLPLRMEDPRFESQWIGLPDAHKTWDQLYAGLGLGAIEVTDLTFVPGHVTGSDPWLLVAGSKSGTITSLRLKGTGAIPTYNKATGMTVDLRLTAFCNVILSAIICTALHFRHVLDGE